MLGVDCHHGMQQRATMAFALADLPQPAGMAGRSLELNLAGILDRQHVPAARCRNGLLRPPLDQALQRHFPIRQKAAKSLGLCTFTVTKPTDAARSAHDRAFEQQRPLFSRRRSSNSPNDQTISNMQAPRFAKVPPTESQFTTRWED